jgi:hypothetical protein
MTVTKLRNSLYESYARILHEAEVTVDLKDFRNRFRLRKENRPAPHSSRIRKNQLGNFVTLLTTVCVADFPLPR